MSAVGFKDYSFAVVSEDKNSVTGWHSGEGTKCLNLISPVLEKVPI